MSEHFAGARSSLLDHRRTPASTEVWEAMDVAYWLHLLGYASSHPVLFVGVATSNAAAEVAVAAKITMSQPSSLLLMKVHKLHDWLLEIVFNFVLLRRQSQWLLIENK